MASFGELGLAAAAIKQRDIQLLFQVLDLKADRRLGNIKAIRSFFETALASNRPQDVQLIESEGEVRHKNRKKPYAIPTKS